MAQKKVRRFDNAKDMVKYLKNETIKDEVVILDEAPNWTHAERTRRFRK